MSKKNTVKLDGPEDMLPEYDLEKMRIIKRGPGHAQKNAARLVRVTIDSDVAQVFGDDRAVNEALRTFLRMFTFAQDLRQPTESKI